MTAESAPAARRRPETVFGIQATREALRAHSRPFQYLVIDRERRDARIEELIQLARAEGVSIRFAPRQQIDRLAPGSRHQGVIGVLAAKALAALEDLLSEHAQPGLLLALDGIEDPRNLGALLRAAAGAGADGIILPARRSAPLNATAAHVAAGGLEHVRVAQVPNLAQALERIKAAGFWTVGLDASAPTPFWQHDFRIPTALVVGGEARGLHPLVKKKCDFLAAIPLVPGVESLNAAVAAAVVLFDVVRQRATA